MRYGLLAVLALLVRPTIGVAQTTAILLQAPAPVEQFGFGATGGLGVPGPIATVRASVPLSARVGADIEAGLVRGSPEDGPNPIFSGQIRLLRHRRGTNRNSDYFVLGASRLRAVTRTRIVWPDRTTILVNRDSLTRPLLGYGWDWLSPHGTRVGVEFNSGGGEEGPRIFLKFFAVWGPAAR